MVRFGLVQTSRLDMAIARIVIPPPMVRLPRFVMGCSMTVLTLKSSSLKVWLETAIVHPPIVKLMVMEMVFPIVEIQVEMFVPQHDEDENNFADECSESTTAVTIAGTDYFGLEVECYCPTEDCQLDINGDGETDCYTPTGDVCAVADDGTGLAATCAFGDPIPFLFTNRDGNPLTAPMNETDNDGDGFVECEYFDDVWIGVPGDGVTGGSDCNDGDVIVFPGATEYCDGQFNNCSDLTYDINGAPNDESDLDGDGYVECAFTAGINWAREVMFLLVMKTVKMTMEPCIQVPLKSVMVNTTTVLSLDMTPIWHLPDETDDDSDGYVECLDGQVVDGAGCACASATDTDNDGIPDLFVDCADAAGTILYTTG